MELFTLLTKLTLDTSEYESALNEAEKQGSDLENIESNLGLDDSEFYEKVEDAEDVDIDDPESPELDLKTDGYTSGLTEAEGSTQDFELSVGKIFDNIGAMVATAGIALGISTLVSQLSEGVDLARELGDNIDKSSQRLNISTDAYQEWNYVLRQNGASISDVSRGIMNMTQFLSGGASEELSNAFNDLGISANDANGNIKTTEQLLSETVKALADYQGSSEDRGALAMAIFGRNGQTLNAMFNEGSKNIDSLIDMAHELGLVMTSDEIANAVAYDDALDNMNSSIEAFKTSMVTELLPILTDVANTVASIVAFFNPRTQQKSLSEIYADKDNAFAEQLATIESTSAVAESLADKLLAMGDTGTMTAEQYAIWKGTAEELIALVPSLGAVIDTETGQINGNSESIRENIKEWENLAKQKAVQNLKEEKYGEILKKNQDLIDKSVEANIKASEAEGARKNAIDALNATLAKRGYDPLDEASSMEEAYQRIASIQAGLGEEDSSYMLELASAQNEWTKAVTEANKVQKEASDLQAELDEGMLAYNEWVATIDAMYGTASDTASEATSDVNKLDSAIKRLPKQKQIQLDVLTYMYNGFIPTVQKAKGDWDVPYDMPVMVHRGETILTASQARRHREGDGDGMNVRAIRTEVAMGIRDGMSDAYVNAYMDGRKVSKKIGSYNSRETASRQRGMGG